MSDNPYTKKYFQFNLVTPKSKKEIGVLIERDNTLFYSFFLIIFGLVLFFALNLIKSLLVDPNLDLVNRNIATVNSQITGFNDIREDNGELYIKARSLDPILDRDVEVTKVLELEAKLRAEFPDLIDVVDYTRNSDGSFAISFNIQNAVRVEDIIDYLSQQPDVDDIFLNNVSWTSGQSQMALVDLTFFLLNITAADG